MASRTKDNDFNRIKLTEGEVISKKKIKSELIRKRLGGKVETTKARIELEEKENMLPKKRRQKSKIGNKDDCYDTHFSKERLQERDRKSRHGSSRDKDKSSVKKPPRPPPPVMSFSELLKVAEANQHKPVVIPQKKNEEEKLMTKKQHRLEEQEQERIRRKLERNMQGPKSSNGSKPSSSSKPSLSNGKSNSKFVGNGQSEPAPAAKPVPVMPVDTDAIAEAIEKRIREKLEKEIEAKLEAKFAAKQQGAPTKVKPSVSGNGSNSKRPVEKMKPEKRPFHPNPYLDPRRPFHPNPYLDPRRLEPIRPQKPIVKRRIEDDSDDEDDLSDFIDYGRSQNDEDYSKYIQDIFGYDKRKYVDDDDDDIVEISFGEQLKEETQSALLGYLDDLKEERSERQRKIEKMKRKKLKK